MIFWKKLNHQFICDSNISGVSTECNPPERSFAFTKKRSDISRNKSREVKCVFKPFFESTRTDIISVIKCNGAFLLKGQHFLNVKFHGCVSQFEIFIGV